MNNRNIILTGMPGAGKSTVGVLLAKALGLSFADTDLAVQSAAGELLQEIINRRGLEEFLKIEENAILSAHYESCVVATGGSAVFSEKAMQSLKQNGICVYLRLPASELEKRLSNLGTRGVVRRPGESVEDILTEREPLYLRYADVTVDCTGLSPERAVDAIIAAVG